MKRMILGAMAALVLAGAGLGFGLGTASAAHKGQVTHVRDDGTAKVLCVSYNAIPAHVNHGDAIVDNDNDNVADPC